MNLAGELVAQDEYDGLVLHLDLSNLYRPGLTSLSFPVNISRGLGSVIVDVPLYGEAMLRLEDTGERGLAARPVPLVFLEPAVAVDLGPDSAKTAFIDTTVVVTVPGLTDGLGGAPATGACSVAELQRFLRDVVAVTSELVGAQHLRTRVLAATCGPDPTISGGGHGRAIFAVRFEVEDTAAAAAAGRAAAMVLAPPDGGGTQLERALVATTATSEHPYSSIHVPPNHQAVIQSYYGFGSCSAEEGPNPEVTPTSTGCPQLPCGEPAGFVAHAVGCPLVAELGWCGSLACGDCSINNGGCPDFTECSLGPDQQPECTCNSDGFIADQVNGAEATCRPRFESEMKRLKVVIAYGSSLARMAPTLLNQVELLDPAANGIAQDIDLNAGRLVEPSLRVGGTSVGADVEGRYTDSGFTLSFFVLPPLTLNDAAAVDVAAMLTDYAKTSAPSSRNLTSADLWWRHNINAISLEIEGELAILRDTTAPMTGPGGLDTPGRGDGENSTVEATPEDGGDVGGASGKWTYHDTRNLLIVIVVRKAYCPLRAW